MPYDHSFLAILLGSWQLETTQWTWKKETTILNHLFLGIRGEISSCVTPKDCKMGIKIERKHKFLSKKQFGGTPFPKTIVIDKRIMW